MSRIKAEKWKTTDTKFLITYMDHTVVANKADYNTTTECGIPNAPKLTSNEKYL